MTLTDEQKETIDTMIQSLNLEVNKILNAREDVIAALRIEESINDDSVVLQIITDAKSRATAATTSLNNLLQ